MGAVKIFFALLALAATLSGCISHLVDSRLNAVYDRKNDKDKRSGDLLAADRKRAPFLVDLHADTTLWSRSFFAKSKGPFFPHRLGHVDLHRLKQGSVALQVFAVATKTPMERRRTRPKPGQAKKCIPSSGLDTAALLQVVQGRPEGNLYSLEKRALYQARLLRDMVRISVVRHHRDRSLPYLKLILDARDLRGLIVDRKRGKPVIGAMMALEGAHWIRQDATVAQIRSAIDRLYAAGFRMLAPTHRFHNNLAASSEGCGSSTALSRAGKIFLMEAEKKGIIVDLAHASDQAVKEASGFLKAPFVISHTGVSSACIFLGGKCSTQRNVSDDTIRAVARSGGVIGIGIWPAAVGEGLKNAPKAMNWAMKILRDPAFARTMRARFGRYDPADHVAFGSDFDGAVKTPIHVGQMWRLTEMMQDQYSDLYGDRRAARIVRKIAGVNACRVFAVRLSGGDWSFARRLCRF